jgi:hypothetical protein
LNDINWPREQVRLPKLTSTPSPLTTLPTTALFSPASWCDDDDYDDDEPLMTSFTL